MVTPQELRKPTTGQREQTVKGHRVSRLLPFLVHATKLQLAPRTANILEQIPFPSWWRTSFLQMISMGFTRHQLSPPPTVPKGAKFGEGNDKDICPLKPPQPKSRIGERVQRPLNAHCRHLPYDSLFLSMNPKPAKGHVLSNPVSSQ